MFCCAVAWGAGMRPMPRGVGDLRRVSTCSWSVNIWLVSTTIFGVDWARPVASRAFPNNWLNVVPPTLTFHPRVHRTIFADAVVAGWAAHAAQRRSIRFTWRIVCASACVNDRVNVAPVLLFQGDDAINDGIAHTWRIVLQLFELFPCRVRVLM